MFQNASPSKSSLAEWATNARKAFGDRIEVLPEFVYGCGDDDQAPGAQRAGKKTLIFFTTISFLAENAQAGIRKISDVLDILSGNADKLKVIWISQCIKGNEDMLENSVASDFREAVARFAALGIGEYAEDPARDDLEAFAGSADAYYGDPSALALKFVYAKKPVMIINVNAVT